MRWPFVSRSKHNVALANCRQLHAKWLEARCEVQALQRSLDIANALRQDEQWRRIKADGKLAFVCDKMTSSRALMLPYITEADDEKLTIRPPKT